jgi:hypothetical protein
MFRNLAARWALFLSAVSEKACTTELLRKSGLAHSLLTEFCKLNKTPKRSYADRRFCAQRGILQVPLLFICFLARRDDSVTLQTAGRSYVEQLRKPGAD